MICALPHRTNPLRSWKILLVKQIAALTAYYAANHLRANPEKTAKQLPCKKPRCTTRIECCKAWELLAYSHKPVYLGATLDRCLTYKDHMVRPRQKLEPGIASSRSWRADARTTLYLHDSVSPLLTMRPHSGAHHCMLQRSTLS